MTTHPIKTPPAAGEGSMSDQTMTTVDILRAARDLISDEKRWTKEFYARVDGAPVVQSGFDKLPAGADCFCAIGSLAKAADVCIMDAEESEAYKILNAIAEIDLYEFNDTHSHDAVLRLFDRAISKAEVEA